MKSLNPTPSPVRWFTIDRFLLLIRHRCLGWLHRKLKYPHLSKAICSSQLSADCHRSGTLSFDLSLVFWYAIHRRISQPWHAPLLSYHAQFGKNDQGLVDTHFPSLKDLISDLGFSIFGEVADAWIDGTSWELNFIVLPFYKKFCQNQFLSTPKIARANSDSSLILIILQFPNLSWIKRKANVFQVIIAQIFDSKTSLPRFVFLLGKFIL